VAYIDGEKGASWRILHLQVQRRSQDPELGDSPFLLPPLIPSSFFLTKGWEGALAKVVGGLEHPPPPGSDTVQ